MRGDRQVRSDRPGGTLSCADVAESLAEAADGSVLLGGEARDHVEHCIRCQAEMVQYRKVLRALRA